MLKRVLLGLSCGALLIAGVLWMGVGANSPRYEVLFELKLIEDKSYASTGLEQQPWGPAAIAVADDGTIWVADGAGRRLLAFAPTGKALRTISLDDAVVGIGDLDALEMSSSFSTSPPRARRSFVCPPRAEASVLGSRFRRKPASLPG